MVSLLHRRVPVIRTDQGVRATVKGQPIDPAGVGRYLAQKLGHELTDVQAAMEALAKAYPPDPCAGRRKIALVRLACLSLAKAHRLLRTLHPEAGAQRTLEAVGSMT
jgi:hypothetical protein